MTALTHSVEHTDPADPYVDFCLWPYQPPAPTLGKLRSSNLLWNSFEVAGASPQLYELCLAIRAAMGPFNTVWGIKQTGDGLTWELYFYDYRGLGRERSLAGLLKRLQPLIRCELPDIETRPYFMFSIDIDDALAQGTRALDQVNVYMGNVGSNVSSGICYLLSVQGFVLNNFYFFFDARLEYEDVVAKVLNSAYLDPARLDLQSVLWPELVKCKTIVIANKRYNDGVYFSRVDVTQLEQFMQRARYPSALCAYVAENAGLFDHLLYDVAFDYAIVDGRMEVLKSSYYGYL